MHRWARVLAASAAVTMLATACGGDDDDAGGGGGSATTTTAAGSTTSVAPGTQLPDDVCTADRKGGQLTFGTAIPSQGLDPTVAQGSGVAGAVELTAIYDTLLRFDPATGDYEPHVAESVTPNADLTEWTVKLRDGITFGNGDPLTADAVKFSIERMKTARVSSAGLAAEVSSVEVLDPLTAVLKLEAPSAQIPYLLAEDTGNITNPAVVEAKGDGFNLDPEGAGVGPYEVERFAPGEEILLRAKDDYWGGPVCIETLRFVYVQGAQATLDAFRNGELDMAFLREARIIADAKAAGVEGFSNIAGAGTILLMNIAAGGGSGSALSDVRLRQAVQYAIDTDVLNQRLDDGKGLPTSALIWKDSPIYPGVDGLPYDLDKAKQLVEEVKASGWDGTLSLVCGNTPQATEQVLTLTALLGAAGITVEGENLPNNEVTARYTAPPYNYEMVCGGSSIFEESPLARLNAYEGGNPRNRTGLADAEMDAALAELRVAGTREEKKAALAKVQQRWNEVLPSAVLNASEEFIATKDTVRGLVYSRDTTPMFHQAYLES